MHLVGLYIELVTMHGTYNVKKVFLTCWQDPATGLRPEPDEARLRIFVIHYPPIYTYIFQAVSFLQVFPPTLCMHYSSPPCMPHFPPASFTLMLSSVDYLARNVKCLIVNWFMVFSFTSSHILRPVCAVTQIHVFTCSLVSHWQRGCSSGMNNKVNGASILRSNLCLWASSSRDSKDRSTFIFRVMQSQKKTW